MSLDDRTTLPATPLALHRSGTTRRLAHAWALCAMLSLGIALPAAADGDSDSGGDKGFVLTGLLTPGVGTGGGSGGAAFRLGGELGMGGRLPIGLILEGRIGFNADLTSDYLDAYKCGYALFGVRWELLTGPVTLAPLLGIGADLIIGYDWGSPAPHLNAGLQIGFRVAPALQIVLRPNWDWVGAFLPETYHHFVLAIGISGGPKG